MYIIIIIFIMYDNVLTFHYLSGYQTTKLFSLTSVFDHSGGKGTLNTGIIIIIIIDHVWPSITEVWLQK